jgi:hypothetical protein
MIQQYINRPWVLIFLKGNLMESSKVKNFKEINKYIEYLNIFNINLIQN